jgi:hypothetical protein
MLSVIGQPSSVPWTCRPTTRENSSSRSRKRGSDTPFRRFLHSNRKNHHGTSPWWFFADQAFRCRPLLAKHVAMVPVRRRAGQVLAPIAPPAVACRRRCAHESGPDRGVGQPVTVPAAICNGLCSRRGGRQAIGRTQRPHVVRRPVVGQKRGSCRAPGRTPTPCHFSAEPTSV